MDDDFDYGPFANDYTDPGGTFGGPTMANRGGPTATETVMAPPRWTSSDDTEYARTAAELNRIDRDVRERVLYPHDAAPLVQQLTMNLAAMDERKSAFDFRQQQQATQAALGVAAMQRGVESLNQQHAADNFLGLVRDYFNPVTGQAGAFFQNKPGEWTQMQLDPVGGPGGSVEGADQGTGEGGQVRSVPHLTPEQEAAGGQVLEGGVVSYPPAGPGATAMGERRQMGEHQAELPATTQAAQGPGRMVIQNGPYSDVYENGQQIATNRPAAPQAQGQAGQFGLPPEKLAEIRNMAAVQSMHLRPGPQRDAMYSHITQRLMGAALVEQGMQRRQAAVAQQQQTRAVAQQVETDYRDQLNAHKAKDYSESADPHAARMDAVMDNFARLHPNDPRVKQWQQERDQRTAELAKKEPAKMSLKELATATLGSHTNVQKLIEAAETEVKKDDREIPGDTKRGDVTYNPKGQGGGVWKDMHPEGIHDEAERRVRNRLTKLVNEQRGGQEQPQQSQAPPALSPALKAKYDQISAAYGAQKPPAQRPAGPPTPPDSGSGAFDTQLNRYRGG